MKPEIGLYDPRFKYVPSYLTDVRETFKRVRAEGRESKPESMDERQRQEAFRRAFMKSAQQSNVADPYAMQSYTHPIANESLAAMLGIGGTWK